jgi:hypothetical protein
MLTMITGKGMGTVAGSAGVGAHGSPVAIGGFVFVTSAFMARE